MVCPFFILWNFELSFVLLYFLLFFEFIWRESTYRRICVDASSSHRVTSGKVLLLAISILMGLLMWNMATFYKTANTRLRQNGRNNAIIYRTCFRFLWPCIVSKVWRERKPTRCNSQMFIINFCLNMFRTSLCPSSGEQRPCVTACGVLRWFCWMWLVAVVGRCVVGCEHCSHPTTHAVTHGLCSPEDGHNDARNMSRQKLIINIWLLHLVGFLSLHTL